MFCAKCGKQIDDDSTFCPFCGQQVGEPVVDKKSVINAKSIIKEGVKKSSTLQSFLNNKMVWGIVLALVATVGVGFGAVKLIGGRKSASEKLLDMSWKDVADMSAEEYSDVLDDKDLLYVLEKAKVSYDETSNTAEHVVTTIADSFLGGECYFEYIDAVHMSMFDVFYETYEDFKSSRKSLDKYLSKNLIKNSTFLTVDHGEGNPTFYYYPVEVSNKKISEYADEVIKNGNEMYSSYLYSRTGFPFTYMVLQNISLEDGEEALRERLSECSIYKFITVSFDHDDGFVDWDIMNAHVGYMINSYIPVLCTVNVSYVPLTEEQFMVIQASQGWDAISGKKIDIDNFKDQVDEKLVRGYLNKKVRENPESREDLEKDFYTKLYMMDKHDLDIVTCSYLKAKEEKKLWYTHNFSWDTDTQSMLDFSEYRNSSDIYCAVEFNYNSSKAEYFESELDKALYLADRNYKLGTGNDFESNEEKRLWFMENYSYDISSGKVIEKEIVDALIAYQKYYDQVEKNMIGVSLKGALIYLNDDNVPECVLIDDIESNSVVPGDSKAYILSYINGNLVVEQRELLYYNFYYTPRNGMMYTKSYGGSAYYGFYDEAYDVIKLSKQFERIGSANYTEQYDDLGNLNHKEYKVDGQEVDSIGLENYISSLGCEISVEFSSIYSTKNKDSSSFLDLYDTLRTTTYTTYEYCIYEYELKDGILTVKADEGANASGFNTCEPFAFSYPVADDCIWEDGLGFGDGRDFTRYITPEDVEEDIRNSRDWYDSEPDYIESPVGIQFRILDEEIVGVYTSTS